MCISLTLRLLSVSLLGFFLLGMQPAIANSADWLQVKRYKEVLQEAQKGKVQSMYEVGLKYERGRGTQRDMQKAAEWYEKAAEANHTPAMARLGILYVEGNGVKRDLNKAIELLKRAAEQGVASAQYQLASMYELGTGVDEDLREAIRLYDQAAKGGYYRAQEKVKELSRLLKTRKRNSVSVAELEPQTTGKPSSPLPKQTGSNDSDKRTLAFLLQGNWQYRGHPVGYLPSTITRCRGQGKNIKCISTAQERSTGTEIIIYNTEATLSNFNGKQFEITYLNHILEIEKEENSRQAVYEENISPATTQSRFQPGQPSKTHKLVCTLQSRNNITCVKDGFRKRNFTTP